MLRFWRTKQFELHVSTEILIKDKNNTCIVCFGVCMFVSVCAHVCVYIIAMHILAVCVHVHNTVYAFGQLF